MTPPEQPSEYYKVYDEYAKNLRTWFVAYGVGGPVLFLTNESIANRIAEAPNRESIIWAFVVGVAAQILLSAVNKYVNWTIYADSKSFWWKVACWISSRVWIDMIVDLGTIVAFGIATLQTLRIFT